MEKPAPPPQVAVAPPPPPQGSVEALRARRQLADIVRNNAEVMLALQLRKNTDDRAIVRALAKVRDLFELLRQAGCSIAQATRAEELMELAIEAPDVKPPKRSRARYFYGAAGVIVFVIFLLVAIIVLEVSQSSQGWEVGTCSMTLFHNQTCFQEMGRCLVEVAVRSGTFFGSKNPWALPIVHVGGRGEIARYQGDPFRCCNDMEGYVGSCCDLVAGGVSAQLAETFCDSWGILGRTDHMGETCPSGSWPCLFTVNYETATVDELMYFSQPDVSVYVGTIAVLVMILVVGVVVRLMQIFDVRCDCSALMPARQDDDADLYDPDDPASDWGQVVQEAALEEARKKRQRNCKGWIQERTASLQEKWQRISKCIRRGKKKEPESPASGRGEAKVRRMTSKSSQGRGASQSVVRSSSKLSRGSRGSRGRSPSKGFQGTGRAESKSSRGSRGVDSDDRSDAPLEEDEDEQEESQPAKSETRKVSATISKEVPEVFEEKRATAACFPPGFVWHDGADPTLVDNLEKYLKWEATGKELEDVEERDIHPGFHAGNLRGMARLARQQHQSLLLPIVEPMTGRSAKSHSYSADTLYYSCSTLRESRRKKRKRGAMKGPGGKQAARSLETPQKWSWATQDEPAFRQLPIENGPQFSKMKVPGAQSQHILSLE